MKLLGIARVSTEEQAGDNGAGLDRQRDAIRKVAEAQGAVLLGIVDIVDVSGSDVGTSREWLTQVLPVIADPDTHIAADALDRLIRASNFAAFNVLASCQQTQTRIYTPGAFHDLDRPDDMLMSGLLALLGGKEKSELVRRAQAGKEAKRRRGQWVARMDILPPGIAYDKKTQAWTVVEPDAQMIRDVYAAARDGATIAEMGRTFGRAGKLIRAWLQNPLYDGRLRFDSKLTGRIANSHYRKKIPRAEDQIIDIRVYAEDQQIVPHELWLTIQARLTGQKAERRRRREITAPTAWASGHLYSWHEELPETTAGYADMSVQPRHVVYGSGTGAKPDDVPRYICRCKCDGRQRGVPQCVLQRLRCDVVNRGLDAYLLELTTSGWFVDAAVRAIGAATVPDTAAARERLEKALVALERRDKRLLDLYVAERIELPEFTTRQDAARLERRGLERELAQLETVPTVPTVEAVHAQAAAWRWDPTWPAERKRKWLARYASAVMLSNDGIEQVVTQVVGDDGSALGFAAGDPRTWAELIGHAATGTEATAALRGAVTTPKALELLGLSSDMMDFYVGRGVIRFEGARVGIRRIWTPQDIEKARQDIAAHRASIHAHPEGHISVAVVAGRLGKNRDQIRHMWETGKIAPPRRDDRGRFYWHEADLADAAGKP